jgi:hypothetical protein
MDPPRLPRWRGITLRGYRIFHSYHSGSSLRSWNQTEVSVDEGGAEFNVWDPAKTYVVKVQAREQDGRYGNLSAVYLPEDVSMGRYQMGRDCGILI